MAELIKRSLFVFLLMMLVFLAVRRTSLFESKASLGGLYETKSKPVFSDSAWFKGKFQEEWNRYVEEMPGLRGTFIRIRNQYDFSLFSIPHAHNVVLGKENCLFGIDNIKSYNGADFAGELYLETKIGELKALQEALWEKKNVLLLVVLAPDKATFFHDLIPDRFLKKRQHQSNYEYYAKRCVELGVNMIDFNHYFLSAKDTTRYPLYAKTGAHWSYYGAYLAADSMKRYIEKKLSIRMPALNVTNIEMNSSPWNYDGDIGNSLNLFWEISQPALAYPQITFELDSTTTQPHALFIGDSYYWIWYESKIIQNFFGNEEFWYYDSDIYPETFTQHTLTWQKDLIQAIDRQKVIVLLQTSKDAECDLGYGFVDRTWPEFDTSSNNRIREIEKFICAAPENMLIFEKKAKDFNSPIKAVIRTDAIYAGNQLLKKGKKK
jgi:hypothetical protein